VSKGITQREQRERIALAHGERALGSPRPFFGATDLDQRNRTARERRDALGLERERTLVFLKRRFGIAPVQRVAEPLVSRRVLRRLLHPLLVRGDRLLGFTAAHVRAPQRRVGCGGLRIRRRSRLGEPHRVVGATQSGVELRQRQAQIHRLGRLCNGALEHARCEQQLTPVDQLLGPLDRAGERALGCSHAGHEKLERLVGRERKFTADANRRRGRGDAKPEGQHDSG